MKTLSRSLLLALAVVLATAAVSFADNGNVPQKPTFARDVAPILHDRCVVCHRPGQIGPMALRTYDEVRPWAKSIAKNVKTRIMPPWHADPGYGPWSNDRSLTQGEIETLVRWSKQGAPAGDLAAWSAPEVEAEETGEWRLGPPDHVITFEEFMVPAGGPDLFKNFVIDPDFDEDKWITAVEILPGDREVVHHVILWRGQVGSQAPESWLGGWAAGAEPGVFPEGTARFLKKGATLIGDLHYHPTDKATNDRTSIGLYFAQEGEVEKELINHWVMNTDFEIPPGDDDYEARATYTFPQDSHILALTPHMHYRGKDFTYTASYPDGRTEELLKVSNYDFNWQTGYEFDKPLAVPQGTRIDCVAHWDNSKKNPDNPDPTKTVRFGPESYDEMMIGFVDYVVDEGVRPKPQEPAVLAKIRELAARYPGEVFEVMISTGAGGAKQPSGLHLPRQGEGGWYVGFASIVGRARVYDIAWSGQDFVSKALIPGEGTIELKGRIDLDAGSLSLEMINEDGETDSVEGTLAKPE